MPRKVRAGRSGGKLLPLLLTLALGCSKGDPNFPGYRSSSGDAAAFILNATIRYGAHPLKTNGLPKLQGEWRYKADNDGIQIYLVGDGFTNLPSFMLNAFGTPAIAAKTNTDGQIASAVYAAPVVGAAIQFGQEESFGGTRSTEVVIVRQGALR